jgi:hypothetical protein
MKKKSDITIIRGDTFDCSLETAICILENLDIMDTLVDRRWNIRKEDEQLIFGYSKATYPLWHKLKLEAIVNIMHEHKGESGVFTYLVSLHRKFFSKREFRAQILYSLATDGRIPISGQFSVENKGFVRLVGDKRVQNLMNVLLGDVKTAANLLSNRFDEVILKLSEEQKVRLEKSYEKYRIRNEIKLTFVPFNELSRVKLQSLGSNSLPVKEDIEIGAEASHILKETDDLVKTANSHVLELKDSFARGDRDLDGHYHENDLDFYKIMRKIGEDLYELYIKGMVNVHLKTFIYTSKNEKSKDPILKIEAEGRDALLPWEIMHDGEDFISLSVPLTRTTALSTASSVVPKKVNITGVLVIASDPNNELHGVEKEGEIILEALSEIRTIKTKLLAKSEATKDNVLRELKTGEYQVLHFSGHSIYDKIHPQHSYLLLEKGRLFAHEIPRISLGKGLQLVFLNSCSSSGNSEISKEMGIADAFIKANIPFVIGMKWMISDEGALKLADEFYQSVLKHKNPIKALQDARIAVGITFDWQDPAWAAPVIYVADAQWEM